MTTENRPREELLSENESLRLRLEEAEETLRAIGSGEVDAFVVSGPDGKQQVFTLKGAEQPYRVLVETMNEGAATLAADGTILYCNNRLAAMLQVPLENLIGTQFGSYLASADRPLYTARLEKCTSECAMDEITLITQAGDSVPVLTSCCTLDLSGNRGISAVITDLTQQKRNEEIMSSEMLARSIIEQAGEAIVVCDEEGIIIRASRTAHQLCGENPLLKPFNELFQLRLLGEEGSFSVLSTLHGGSVGSAEVEFKRSDDRIFHLILNATPLESSQNLIIGSVVTLTDITEHRQAEEALRESDLRYRALFNNSLNGLVYGQIMLDDKGQPADYRFLDVNDTFVDLTGLEKASVIGRTAREVMPGIENASFDLIGVHGKVALSGEEVMFEQWSEYFKRWYSVFVFSPKKEYFITIFSDITDRVHTEEALRAAHDRINAILEQMSDGFASYDRDWRYTYINQAAANAFHMAPEQLLGKSIWEMWPSAYDLPLGVNFRRSLQEDIPIQFETYYPAPLNRWFECRCHPTPEGLVTFFSDITERKHAEEALKESNQELERRVAERTAELREKDQMLLLQSRQAAMGEMIGNIAHQWRQPLNLLGLTVQQLLMFYDLGEFDRTFLAENVDSSLKLIQHMSRTVDDFRNYFKPDKEKAEFKVREAIANTLSLLEGSFQDPHISVEIVEKDEPVIYGFRNELAQVVLNLVVNAKDVITEREINDPKVTITLSSENGCSVVTVADNAGGIPEEILDKIFEPYFSTKGERGTGVGLFMSKNIIEKNMGGTLTVRNVSGGAEFRIELCCG
jgi:PAS domain S-box-containing protein